MKTYLATWENSQAYFGAETMKEARRFAAMHKRQSHGEIKGVTSVRFIKKD